jgi:glutamine amidotransferase
LCGTFQPVGTTDSERAACLVFQHLRETFGCHEPQPEQIFAALADIAPKIAEYGTFNFLLSNGQSLFAFATTKLHWIVREYPFAHAHLVDIDMSIDFSKHTTAADRVAVIATEPLTDNEQWTAFERGQLLWFQHGKIEQSVVTDASRFAAPTLPNEQPPTAG